VGFTASKLAKRTLRGNNRGARATCTPPMIRSSSLSRAWLPATVLLLFASGWSGARAQTPTPPVVADFGDAVLETWVQAEYPASARQGKQEGQVTVEFVVEADGTVSREHAAEGSDPVFSPAALAAVKQWRFKPALENAKPVASAMAAVIPFSRDQLGKKPGIRPPAEFEPRPLKSEPPQPQGSIDPGYPQELEEARLSGAVRLHFTVDAEGQARNAKILFASHPAFVEAALQALAQAKFNPAHQGFLVRSAEMDYAMGFASMGATPAQILAANHLEVLTEVVRPPQPVMLIQPVYPRDALLAGQGGSAVAEFTVGGEGTTSEIAITQSAGPEFDRALRAAIESWVFKEALGAESPIPAKIRVTYTFAPPANNADARLVSLLQPDGGGIGGAGGLDRKLVPLWRGFPAYPQEFLEQQLKGEATIEFVIDRDGRCRVPRIVNSSADAFGWAAATAVSQWVFERPMRGGQPVDVTVRIPVAFKPPAK